MKPSDEDLKKAVDILIRQEIQGSINDYVDSKEETQQGGLGFIEEDELKLSVSQKEIEKIIKQYKKLKKSERSNLSHIKKLGDG
ncbi:MAG: hypothetical protein CBC89_04065 [Euryarchaeota archaeon TMED129]|nr:MAG: hypothetical protein CBC89_04065 [Euryarchaeota archaeon TMED129]|tara:strand:- start:1398 stop:1649 length:252 start_codon:yes stop_codon:yes gene_type:complete